MGFKRAEWHSGLVYRMECDQCRTVVEYMDDQLGFRPWFADGFVYCPNCKKPLRHSERNAITSSPAPQTVVIGEAQNAQYAQQSVVTEAAQPQGTVPERKFCFNCGAKLNPGALFCASCGTKQS